MTSRSENPPGPQVGRIAFRVEGDFWCCYYTKPDTMEGAIALGNIRMAIVNGNTERRQIFIDLMKHAIAELFEVELGTPPTSWDERRAPEHERAGRG